MKKFCMIGLCFFTLACAVKQNGYEQKLSSWLGQSDYALFNAWGEPDESFAVDEKRYVWVYNQTNLKPHNELYKNVFLYEGWKGFKYGLAQNENTYYCKTYFTIENNVVVDYSFIGDDCY